MRLQRDVNPRKLSLAAPFNAWGAVLGYGTPPVCMVAASLLSFPWLLSICTAGGADVVKPTPTQVIRDRDANVVVGIQPGLSDKNTANVLHASYKRAVIPQC